MPKSSIKAYLLRALASLYNVRRGEVWSWTLEGDSIYKIQIADFRYYRLMTKYYTLRAKSTKSERKAVWFETCANYFRTLNSY